ncbi:MAG: GntR family transcriptional regulator [Tannerella sp.]|jgi:DNA-binding transcriptional regulator YhcF (GntR family)|nr:GntR family transcriptional regulator [Tannerella sp.]
MDFKEKQAIYLQIADYVGDHILTGQWPAGRKILSIRDLAVKLEVNPNTVMRTYEYLQQKEIIFNKRGIGYFAQETAPEAIRQWRKQRFFDEELPQFIKTIRLLGIDFEDIIKTVNNQQVKN